jgi:hypothetical protein
MVPLTGISYSAVSIRASVMLLATGFFGFCQHLEQDLEAEQKKVNKK